MMYFKICTESVSSTAEHLSCRVTGRPCCIGLQAQCIIASQEQCNFLEGYFHGDAFLCSQVKYKGSFIVIIKDFLGELFERFLWLNSFWNIS